MLTANEIYEEYTKCLIDQSYVIETYFKTFDKTNNGYVPFKLFDKQKEIVRSLKNHRHNIIAKPRQAGVSTTVAATTSVLLGFADENNPEAILIVANKQDMAFEFLSKIKDFLNQIPRWAWGPDYYGSPEKEKKTIFSSESKKEIRLPNGCRVKAVATSPDALRGYTPTLLIMDEAAFIEDGKELFGAAQTALGTGGRSVLISTPNGLDELYYETYDLALKKLNNFNIIEMRWYQDDRYNIGLKWYRYTDKEKKDKEVIDEDDFTFDSYRNKIADGYKPTSPWYEEMCRGMNNDARMIAQELDVSFLGSGGNVVSDEYVQHHKNRNVQDPIYVSGSESELWVWESPIEGHEYILASDVSRGDGADYSTFTIIDFATMTQVAEYMGRIPPDKLSHILFEYGTLYNALIVVDITGGMGVATVLKLQDMKYPNLYYGEKGGQGLKKRKDMNKYSSDNEIAGFQVGSDRTRLVSTFEKMIRINKDEGDDHGIKIRSTRLLSELNSFVYINGRADHTKGKHDDLIMAMAMALFILDNSFKQLKAIDQKTKAMLASWVSFSSSGELKVADVNNINKNKSKPNFNPIVAKNMQDPTGEYMWLFGGFG